MTGSEKSAKVVLLVQCPDKRGVVSAVADFITRNKGNILDCKQHVDTEAQTYFMRVVWDLDGFLIPRNEISGYFANLVAKPFDMKFELFDFGVKPRLALMVSKYPHCLLDILSRYSAGELDVEIPLIISNHPDAKVYADRFGVEFHHVPVTASTKPEAEAKVISLLEGANIDLIILARYMQILSSDFVDAFENRIINIHHSFLPAFPGSKPYHSAYKRGVKIIGATSHYVTSDLDEGPIIEQDIVRVSHEESVEDLIRHGRDLEKIVLARAIFHHTQHRVIVNSNRTVIF